MADDDPSWARFLLTDPRDVGCAEAWRLIHVYAERVADGSDPEADFPGIAAHLAACGPCADDFQGLLHTLRESTGSRTTGLTDS